MKLSIAYLLLLLVISPNLYGAESTLALQDSQGESSELAFTGQTVKGLTEAVDRWGETRVASKWQNNGRQKHERKLASFVIFGSEILKPQIGYSKDKDAIQQRAVHAYHFIEAAGAADINLYIPVADIDNGAEKMFFHEGADKSTKIKQFGTNIRSTKHTRNCSHLTSTPNQSDDNVRYGYKSQLLQGLISTQEDYKESEAKGALKRSLVVANALRHELQKDKKALAIREKQVVDKKREVEALKTEIASFNIPMSNEFVFYMNALIDVHQSENLYHQPLNPDSDECTIDCIFNAGNDEFILNRTEFTTKKKDGSEHVVHFGPLMKKDGRLPVEECGTQARKIYQSWRTSFGEPVEATALRTAHGELMAKRKELEKEQLVDKQLFIKDQIEILQESRDDAFKELREKVFEAAKMLTSKDLAAYCNVANNRIRLAFMQDYLSDESSTIAIEEQELVHHLLYMTEYQRSLNVPTAKAIMELIDCDAATADLLAQQVNAILANLNDPLLQQHESTQLIDDEKGKDEIQLNSKESLLSKPVPANDDSDSEELLESETPIQPQEQSASAGSSSGIFGNWW